VASELSPARARELIPADALAQVPGSDQGNRFFSLAGGRVNKTFRVDTTAGRFVLRLQDPVSAVSLGVDHAREGKLQGAAAAVGVAPFVVYMDPRQRFMICEYLEGRIWTPDDFNDVVPIRRLGETLFRVHAVESPVPAPFDLESLIQGFADRLMREVPMERTALKQWLAQAQISLKRSGSETRAPTLFHSDPQHGNILEPAGRLVLLDWEYAAVGDPLYDLACVLAYYPHAQAHSQELIAASGLAGQATLEMLEHTTWLYVLLNHVWERIRRLEAGKGAGVRLSTSAD
jgi:aminoglycoside phosphotransferase (APT) family kinase protein